MSGSGTAAGDAKLVTLRFVTVVAAGGAYFLSLGMLLPVVPLYISGPLGGSELAVGVIVGSFAVGAVVVRPLAGRLGDNLGRRVLVIAGGLIVAVSVLGYHLSAGMVGLFAARLVGGVGEAAFFVGAGTMVTDLAPASRRGEAISYWSIAVYGGLAFGPSLGETLLRGDRFALVWTVSAGLALLSAAIGCFTRETMPRSSVAAHEPRPEPAPLINRRALAPGAVLFLGMMGLAGFAAFVPLYVSEVDMDDSRGIFLLYGCTILVVRLLGARIPDRIGPVRAGLIATSTCAAGLAVIAVLHSSLGLYLGTFVLSLGMSLLYPAMLTLALVDVPERERGSAVGTISSFFDLSQGLGAAILGAAVALAGYRGAFLTSAVLALVGFSLLRWGMSGRDDRGGPVVELGGQVEPEPT